MGEDADDTGGPLRLSVDVHGEATTATFTVVGDGTWGIDAGEVWFNCNECREQIKGQRWFCHGAFQRATASQRCQCTPP